MSKILPAYPAWSWLPWKPKPVNPTEPILSGLEAQRILKPYFRYVFVLDRTCIYLADRIRLLALWNDKGVGNTQFEEDAYDCDDFSFDAMGVCHRPDQKEMARMALFMAWIQKPEPHELIAGIDKDGVFLAWPQSKRITPMTTAHKGYHVFG